MVEQLSFDGLLQVRGIGGHLLRRPGLTYCGLSVDLDARTPLRGVDLCEGCMGALHAERSKSESRRKQ